MFKILHLSVAYKPRKKSGGIGTVIENYIKSLDKEKFHQVVLVNDFDLDEKVKPKKYIKKKYEECLVYYFHSPVLPQYSFSPEARKWLKQNIKSFDLIHVHSLFNFYMLYGAFYAIKNKVPFVITLHGCASTITSFSNYLIKKTFIFLFYFLISQAKYIHFTSEYEYKTSLIKKKPFIFPLILKPIQLYSKVPAQQSKTDHVVTNDFILLIGRYSKQKNTKILLESFVEIISTNYPELDLVLIGNDEINLEKEFSKKKNQQIARRIHFLKPMDTGDLIDYYQKAKIFILPSINESFSIVCAEAIESGTPIITSEHVSITNSFPEIKAITTFCKLNTTSIADQVSSVLDNYSFYKARAEKNKNLIKALFSPEKIVGKLKELYGVS